MPNKIVLGVVRRQTHNSEIGVLEKLKLQKLPYAKPLCILLQVTLQKVMSNLILKEVFN